MNLKRNVNILPSGFISFETLVEAIAFDQEVERLFEAKADEIWTLDESMTCTFDDTRAIDVSKMR